MPEPTARDRMPEIVEYAIRRAGFDPDDVADWRVTTGLNRRPDINVLLKPELPGEIEFTVVKDSDG